MSTKPWSSSAAQPDSQSEAGSAPMKENSAAHGSSASPSALGDTDRVRCPVAVERGDPWCSSARSMRGVGLDAVDEVARHARRRGRARG